MPRQGLPGQELISHLLSQLFDIFDIMVTSPHLRSNGELIYYMLYQQEMWDGLLANQTILSDIKVHTHRHTHANTLSEFSQC